MKQLGTKLILVATVILGLEAATLVTVRIRVLLLLHLGVIAGLAFLHRTVLLRDASLRRTVLTVGAVSLVPVLAAAILPYDDPIRAVVEELLPTLIGWAVFLVLLPLMTSTPDAESRESWRPGHWYGAALVIASFLILAGTHYVAVGRFAFVSDEAVYLTQSRWMAPGAFTWSVDQELAPFFIMRKVDYINGNLYGMYPPGWPALLAVFRFAGLEWWSSVILGTLSIALIYIIGAQMQSRRAGALAAAMLSTSQFFLVQHAGYMAHAASISTSLAALWCLLLAPGKSRGQQLVLGLIAGTLLGFGVTVRPLTGVILGVSVVSYAGLRAWSAHHRVPVLAAVGILLGGVLPAFLLLSYNKTVFGDPFAVSYQVISPGTYDLGFGQRGVRVLDADGNWVPGTFSFGPLEATRALLRRIAGLNTTFIPVGMLAPIIATAIAAGFRIAWLAVACFALLPIAHFFYWGEPLRLYMELLPFLVLATALMLATVYRRWPRMALGLAGSVIISHLVLALPWPAGSGGGHRPWTGTDYVVAKGRRETVRMADSLARVHGPLLLFSREASRFDNQIDRLYQFNGDRFDGPILVVRDRGEANESLISRFPDRMPFLVEDQGANRVARFTRIVP
ncbi:MAG TPA: glycosyltransferase family 39 protein [Gemmatimonadaceae bacterium]